MLRRRPISDVLVNELPAATQVIIMRRMSLVNSERADSAAVRRAGPEDAASITDILFRSRQAAVGAIPASAHSQDEFLWWIRSIVLPEREVWLAEDADGRTLAVLVLDQDWVDQLYVDPDFTGMGLGSRLIDLAKSLRPAGLQLWTFQSNLGAQRFYRRHGFTEAERTDGSGNEEKAPDSRFVWTAPAS